MLPSELLPSSISLENLHPLGVLEAFSSVQDLVLCLPGNIV